MTHHANNARAMLIGVDNYRDFDPSGRRDLRGSVNDVRSWWEVCQALGIAPGNVRIFASPAPGEPKLEMHGVHVEEATRENILRGVAWLAQSVGPEQRTGLLTYSGHGAYTADDLALCPSDITQDGEGPLKNLIEFATLKRALGDADGLTIVLDTCYAGAAAQPRGALALTRGPAPAGVVKKLALADDTQMMASSPLGGRLLLATGADQLALQSNFGGRVHGAFTWALTSALLQWAKVKQEGTTRLDLSYATARATAATLLQALSYKQAPVLAPAAAAQLSVFQAAGVAQPTSVLPDGKVKPQQIDPGQLQVRYYTVTNTNTGAILANILVPAVSGIYKSNTYLAGTEYWFAVGSASEVTSMTFTWTDYNWPISREAPLINVALGVESFTMIQGAVFSASGAPPDFAGVFVNVGANIAVDWRRLGAPPSYGGSLTWYDTSGEDNVFAPPLTSPQVLTSNTTDSNPVSWYGAVVNAVVPG